MTDQERVVALLNDLGIVFVIHPADDIAVDDRSENGPGTRVVIGTDGPRNVGYFMFECVFTFNTLGGFVHIGVWE